jgi:Flp pilus assembly protein CpaB
MKNYDDASSLPDALSDRPRGRRRREKNATTRRSVSTQFTLFIVFALIAGLLAVFLVTERAPTTFVARVKAPLAAGMLVEFGDASRIEVVSIPSEAVEPGTYSDSNGEVVVERLRVELAGQRTIFPLSAGQQLRPEFFTGVGSGLPDRTLLPDERQISITAKASRSVAGTIRPGDRVDVYAVTNSGVSGVLGENIEVIAVSLPPDSLENAASAQADQQDIGLAQIVPTNAIGGTYVLKVKANDAAKYFAADTGGAIYLALRGPDALDTRTEPTNALQAICEQSVSPACRER